ncbi:MAG: nucleotidyltransferase domain-containing protein [archaeon]
MAMQKFTGLVGLDALKKTLKKYSVGAVYIFGTQISGKTTPLSDIDIGIVFMNQSAKEKDPSGTYTALEDALKKYFNSPKARIDIVYLGETSFYFQMNTIKSGTILYSHGKKFREDYEDYVMMRYLDWKYVEETFNREMMEAI